MEQFEEAAMLFERALERSPDDWIAAGFLAATYAHLGREEEAAVALQRWKEGGEALGYETGLSALSLGANVFGGVGFNWASGLDKKRWLDGMRKAGLTPTSEPLIVQ